MRAVTVQGKQFRSIKEAANYYGIPAMTVYNRMHDVKWNFDSIFLLPVIERQNHHRRKASA